MDGGYKGWNTYIERHLAIFVNYFRLERTNQLNPLPDKDLVDLCPPIEPYQVTKNPTIFLYVCLYTPKRRLNCSSDKF